MTPMDTPTPQQAACLQSMFDHFNGELFNGTLDRHGVILCWTILLPEPLDGRRRQCSGRTVHQRALHARTDGNGAVELHGS